MIQFLKDKRTLLIFLVISIFTAINIYFLTGVYEYEKKTLVKHLHETLTNTIDVYQKINTNYNGFSFALEDTSNVNSDTNLIQNADFEQGYANFESDYERLTSIKSDFNANPNGWSLITKNAFLKNGNWKGKGYSGNDYFLLLDGAYSKNRIAWQQSMAVQKNKYYIFSFYTSSLANIGSQNNNTHWSLARINVFFNTTYSGTCIAPKPLNKWVKHSFVWYSDTCSHLTIQLTDENQIDLYNDFGIDHLSLSQTNNTSLINYIKGNHFSVHETTIDSNKVDTTILIGLLQDEWKYREKEISFNLIILPTAEYPKYKTNNNIQEIYSDKYFERYFMRSGNYISTFFYNLNNAYSASIGVYNYKSYLYSKIIWFIVVLSLVTCLSLALLWYSYRITKYEKQINAFKYQLTNNITHELKTPVATILAAMEALKNHGLLDDRTKTEKYLDITQIQATKLNSLIENVLTIAKTNDESFKLNLTRIDLNTVILETLNAMVLPSYVNVTLQLHTQPLYVNADKLHLSSAIQTLIDNSIKYRKDNTAFISIQTALKGKQIALTIEDKGIGIDKKFHSLVFEKFYRVPTIDVHNAKGHGLGLSYVQTIAKLHHAKITLKSELNQGTTITLLFDYAA